MAFQNFFATKLYTDIGASDTTITLEIAPTATSGRLTLEARNPTQREIVKYTGVSGNMITGVTRGQGGTTAKSHLKNALVEMNATGEDLQDLYDAFASFSASNNSWLTGLPSVSSVSSNTQHSYNVTFTSTVAAMLSPGMRLRTTRTVAAPTQCTSLNGTTNYFNKTSPSGMTFTDDFVALGWFKFLSYPTAGSSEYLMSRYTGTGGWVLRIDDTGTIVLAGYNGSSANFSLVGSNQSVPLNKWVHITAQLDMSSFTATATTSYIMIDGVSVPSVVARGGTNPTTLTQTGNLEIGSRNGGNELANVKVAQAAVFNQKITQATAIGYMSQGLAGTETGLISAYSFNNTLNDLNTVTANNLTAQGSAVATEADSPFGCQANDTISSTLDYAIVTAVSGSTVTVQVPEGCTIPTTGGVSATAYSFSKAPYAMPTSRTKWSIQSLARVDGSQGSPVSGTIYNPKGLFIALPTGKWKVYYSTAFQLERAASGSTDGTIFYTTTNLSTAGEVPGSRCSSYISSGTSLLLMPVFTRIFEYSTSSLQILYSNFNNSAAYSAVSIGPRGDWTNFGGFLTEAENAYL